MGFSQRRSIPQYPMYEMTTLEFKRWLKQFDVDGDGRLSKAELREAIRSLGSWFAEWKSKQALRAADLNGSGFIEDSEIENLIPFAKKHLGLNIVTW